MASRLPLWIFVDWDETITSEDTLKLIAPPESSERDAPPPISFFGDYYNTLLQEHAQSFGPRDSLERQLEYLDSVGVVERASIRNVEEFGVFKGLREADICERAQHVKFREGWKEFTEEAAKRGDVQLKAIISVNWSTIFIRSALQKIHDEGFMTQIAIHANVYIYISNEKRGLIDRTWKWIPREKQQG